MIGGALKLGKLGFGAVKGGKAVAGGAKLASGAKAAKGGKAVTSGVKAAKGGKAGKLAAKNKKLKAKNKALKTEVKKGKKGGLGTGLLAGSMLGGGNGGGIGSAVGGVALGAAKLGSAAMGLLGDVIPVAWDMAKTVGGALFNGAKWMTNAISSGFRKTRRDQKQKGTNLPPHLDPNHPEFIHKQEQIKKEVQSLKTVDDLEDSTSFQDPDQK